MSRQPGEPWRPRLDDGPLTQSGEAQRAELPKVSGVQRLAPPPPWSWARETEREGGVWVLDGDNVEPGLGAESGLRVESSGLWAESGLWVESVWSEGGARVAARLRGQSQVSGWSQSGLRVET